MSNDFFDNHPMLGSVFDFDHDGSMSLGEAGAMAAMGGLVASEYMRAIEDDEFDDDYGSFPERKASARKPKSSAYDFDDEFVEYDENRVYEVDTSDADVVMDAIVSGDFDKADIEYLVNEALCSGVVFDRDDAEEILEYIDERGLRDWVESFMD